LAAGRPGAVLFACSMNAVRSPMAEALLKYVAGRSVYVNSAGAKRGDKDPFAVEVMEEIGLDIARHRPRTFEELEDLEGFNFDLVISLSPEAHHKALEFTRSMALDVEYWSTPDPTVEEGNRERRLDAYRAVRDHLMRRIRARFPAAPAGS
jgi:protein-tyrosine-phosphatase